MVSGFPVSRSGPSTPPRSRLPVGCCQGFVTTASRSPQRELTRILFLGAGSVNARPEGCSSLERGKLGHSGWISDVLAMSWAQAEELLPTTVGGTALMSANELRVELSRAEALGLLPVAVPAPGPSGRGRLALELEAAIEDALMRRGACPPGIGAAASLEESLSDQLYRSRLIEMRGLVLGVPSLEGTVGLGGALDPEDSAVLRWWLGVARERPVRLLLDRANSTLLVYGPPRPLDSFFVESPRVALVAVPESSPALAPEVASSAKTMELSEPPPAVVEQDGALSFQAPLEETPETTAHFSELFADAKIEVVDDRPSSIGELAEAVLETLSAATPAPSDVTEQPPVVSEEPAAVAAEPEPAIAAEPEPSLAADASPEAPVSRVEAAPAPVAADPEPAAEPAPERPALEVPPLYPRAKEEWPGWVRDLEATRGPRPLAVIERTFVASYVPLRAAVSQGIAEGAARRALDIWSQNFANSYRDAFDALRVRGKRPAMVLDAPDIALRTARLHGARTVQLLLIDGLRFDLGLRVEQRVRALMGHKAALAERLLLWSALPSTTEVQLELIGRGAPGLSELTSAVESELPVARGRGASTPRRVKAGHRDLFKLDLIEARLSEPGAPEAERLDALADEVSTAVADFLGKQPARTLVLAFGDHGFCLDSREHGTTAAVSGGASPEEVLVPAFAWLVGGLH